MIDDRSCWRVCRLFSANILTSKVRTEVGCLSRRSEKVAEGSRVHRMGGSALVGVLVVITMSADVEGEARARGGAVHVKGYIRRNGTYVAPHVRSAPDGEFWNNWSTEGNVNPYTGQPGTRAVPPGTPSRSSGGETTGGAVLPLPESQFVPNVVERGEGRTPEQQGSVPVAQLSKNFQDCMKGIPILCDHPEWLTPGEQGPVRGAQLSKNLQGCMKGIPILCDHPEWLTPEEQGPVRGAQLAKNLQGCMKGIPILCEHPEWLTPAEEGPVRRAQLAKNLQGCMKGIPILCEHPEWLTPAEEGPVRRAQLAKNLQGCMKGIPILCEHPEWLTPAQQGPAQGVRLR
jgi:hypothetical protein